MKTQASRNQLGIVVGVDGSRASTAAVKWAAHDAAMRNVPLTLIHAVTPGGPGAGPPPKIDEGSSYWLREGWAHRVIEEAHRIAAEVTAPSRLPQINDDILYAPTVPTLIELSKQAEMVVVGKRGWGALTHTLLRSVGYHLIRHAYRPVSVIPDGVALQPRSPQAPVVVGIDGSPISESAAAVAFDEASRRGVGLVAVHTWFHPGRPDFGRVRQAPIEWAGFEARAHEVLAEHLLGWQERYPDVGVHKVTVSDRPAHQLLKQAETAQLLVVGSRGRGPTGSALLGSVSYEIIGSAPIPVIVARPPSRYGALSGSEKPERVFKRIA